MAWEKHLIFNTFKKLPRDKPNKEMRDNEWGKASYMVMNKQSNYWEKATLLKAVYRFNIILPHNFNQILHRNRKKIFKAMQAQSKQANKQKEDQLKQWSSNHSSNLNGRRNSENILIPDLKVYNRAIIAKTVWC